MFKSFLSISSPPVFYSLASRAYPITGYIGITLISISLIYGIFITPPDAQQGEVYKVIYLHVPAAWMSMFLYLIACGYAVIFWIWRTDVSAVMMRAVLPTGAWMTVIALITGSLWGKPTWGTYWVWDARLTTELLLLFIYLGLIAVGNLIEDERKTDKTLSIMTVLGIFNIPLIYFSVVFWNTLHQGFSVGVTQATMASDIKVVLFITSVGFWFICLSITLLRAKGLLIARQTETHWPLKYLKLD
tara:strand:+ start:1494 stop:2228 length:735 start_codon:yes stop_codon:yes gene_type:complete